MTTIPKIKLARTRWSAMVISALAVWGMAFVQLPSAAANVTNVIWQASLTGQMAIQGFDKNLTPYAVTASFKKNDFLTMLGVPTGTSSGNANSGNTLALTIDMVNGQTNIAVTVYNIASRQNILFVTGAGSTVTVQDGQRLIFDLEANLPPSGATWGGGHIRIAGTGRLKDGVPSGLKGNVTGVFVDGRPNDIGGSTGLVVRAKLSTSGKPLRVQPPTP